MNNQANKQIDIADILNDILRDLQDLNSKLAKKDEIMRKCRFENPIFYGYPGPHAFSDWLADIECCFDNYRMSDLSKIQSAELRLVGPAKFY